MRLFLLAVVLGAAALLLPSRSEAATTTVTQVIYEEAARYGVSGDWLYWVAFCETGGTMRTDLVGAAGERGLFQWHPRGVWWSTPAGKAGEPIPAGNLRLDVSMAAWAFSRGLSFHWSCA